MKIRDIARSIYWNLPVKVTDGLQSLRNERSSTRRIYRPYFIETESIYIHIPKVAGKSISLGLYGEDPQHHKLMSFELLDRQKFEKYFKFGFVRNPWSRLYSTYNHLIAQEKKFPYGRYSWVSRFHDFEEFVLSGLSVERAVRDSFLSTQFSYLTDSTGQLGVDFIGRFESIDEDYQYVAQRLGISNDLRKIGESAVRKNYRDVYSNEMKNKVSEIYWDDVNTFRYEF